MKRKKGSLMKMLPILMGMIVLAVLSLMYITYIGDIDKKEAADQLIREYILNMETEGYLNADAENRLVNELESIGFININLSGTTLTCVGYGKEITLAVTARLPVTRYITADSEVKKTQQMDTLSIIKKSTAKH